MENLNDAMYRAKVAIIHLQNADFSLEDFLDAKDAIDGAFEETIEILEDMEEQGYFEQNKEESRKLLDDLSYYAYRAMRIVEDIQSLGRIGDLAKETIDNIEALPHRS